MESLPCTCLCCSVLLSAERRTDPSHDAGMCSRAPSSRSGVFYDVDLTFPLCPEARFS